MGRLHLGAEEVKGEKWADPGRDTRYGDKSRKGSGGKSNRQGITTYAFIGPILPGLTRLDEVLDAVRGHVDFVVAEALNIRCGSGSDVRKTLQRHYPDLWTDWQKKVRFREYWKGVEAELTELCREVGVPLGGFYLHGGRQQTSGTTG